MPDRVARPAEPASLRGIVRERWDVLLAIAAGGALGSLGRWVLGELVPHEPDEVAVSTWTVNVLGALALGMLMVFVLDVWPPSRYVRPFLGVGVLGGFTTFSAYMLDTFTLLGAGRPALLALYLFGTMVSGLVAVWLGVVLARAWVRLLRRRHERRADRRQASASPEGHTTTRGMR